MFSKIILKLIDKAIIPVTLIISVRFITLFIISEQYKLDYIISQSGIIFSNTSEFIFANSVSLLLTTIITFLGTILTIASNYFFNHKTISPMSTAKLFSYKLGFLIQNSTEAYSKISLWVLSLWLLTFYLGLAYNFKQVENVVFIFSFVSSVIASVITLIDIEKKYKVHFNNDFIYDSDDKFLESNSK